MKLRISLIATLLSLVTHYILIQRLLFCFKLLIALPIRHIGNTRHFLPVTISLIQSGWPLLMLSITCLLFSQIARNERILVHILLNFFHSCIRETIELNWCICLCLGHSTEHCRFLRNNLLHHLILRPHMI